MIYFSWQRALAILVKELIQLKRDTVTLRMIIAVPLMQLILFGYALNTDPKHLPSAILAQDSGMISRALIKGFENTEYFSFKYNIRSDQEGHELLRRGDVLFVVTIPANFEKEVVQKENLNLDGWQGYLCGPPPMVDAAGECLTRNGISEDEIFYDKFTDASNS